MLFTAGPTLRERRGEWVVIKLGIVMRLDGIPADDLLVLVNDQLSGFAYTAIVTRPRSLRLEPFRRYSVLVKT